MKDILWGWSGASARAIALFTMGKEAMNVLKKPTVMVGQSSGAIVMPIIAVAYEVEELIDIAIDFASTLNTEDMFPYKGNKPFGKNGNPTFNNYLRLLIYGHFGWQDIRPLYKKVFTDEYFKIFKNQEIQCYGYGVDGQDWSVTRYHFNLAKDVDELIDMIESTARIIPFVQEKYYNEINHVDGGFIAFNPAWLEIEKLQKTGKQIEEVITFYSHEVQRSINENVNWNKGTLKAINKVTQAMLGTTHWLSIKDSLLEEAYSKLYRFNYCRLEAPNGYTDDTYEDDNEQLISLGNAAREKAKKQLGEYIKSKNAIV